MEQRINNLPNGTYTVTALVRTPTEGFCLFTANGGAVVDVLLNVHEDNVSISANQLNGDVLTPEGAALSDAPIAFGQAVKIKMAPAPDFTYTGIVLTHGYNLDGPEYVRDNRQYKSVTIPASSFDKATHEYTIPAAYIDGEVRIEGLFTPGSTPDPGEGGDTCTVTYKKNVDGTFYQGGSAVALGQGWAAAEWVSSDSYHIKQCQQRLQHHKF